MAMKIYTSKQGTELVRTARAAIELYIKNPHFDKSVIQSYTKEFDDKYGIFVTLMHYPTNELRGCIGFLYGSSKISESIVDAAIAAAFEDPRFVSVSSYELNELIIEVSILSELKNLGKTAASRKNNLVIGRDGLVVEYGLYRGLLLPNVATEQNFSKEEFLEAVCKKAGIPKNYWMQPNVKLYKFETQIFCEEEPNGKIVEKNLYRSK